MTRLLRVLARSSIVVTTAMLTESALAQSDDVRDCTSPRPIAGTVRYELGQQARRTNAQAFSAVHFAQVTIFPELDRKRETEDTVFVGGFGASSLIDAVAIPTVDVAVSCPETLRYATRPLDLIAMTQGFGIKFGPFGLFYATGMTASYIPPGLGAGELGNITYRGVLVPMMFAMYAFPYSYAAPFGADGFSKGPQSFVVDYVGGGQVDLGEVGVARAGYVGSTGVYSNVTGKMVRAFLSSMVEDELGLAYFAAGVDRQPIANLLVSAFGRKLPLVSVPRVDPATLAPKAPAEQLSFWSAHTQVLSIGGYVDVMAAYGVEPEPTLHELRAGAHTLGFHRSPGPAKKDERTDDFAVGCGVWGGVVQMPDMWYYGIEGALRATVDAGCKFTGSTGGSNIGEGRFGIRRNHPDTFALFPYAVDAWNGYYEVSATF